jgi:hypothetical protein
MSKLSNYIRTAEPYQLTFSDVKELFESKKCRVLDDEKTYMIVPPTDYSVFSEEPANFQYAMEHAVGTILSKSDHTVVCSGFSKTHDASSSIKGRIAATEYLGGTMINAFCHEGTWRLATNGSLDAYKNFWISPKSIGSLFDEMLCKIYRQSTTFASSPLATKLNPGYSYQFVLQNPEIHFEMVERPMIYHIGTFDNLKHVFMNDVRADRLPQPNVHLFNNFADMLTSVKSMDVNFGYTYCHEDNQETQTPRFKLLTYSFARKQKLIGRTSNMYLRYMEAKSEGIDQELIQTFPTIRKFSSWVDKSMLDIAKKVTNLYIEKFVKKNHSISINFYLRPIIAAAHQNYQQKRTRVTVETVMTQLFTENPKRLNFILNGLGYINTNDVRLPEPEVRTIVDEFKLPEIYVGAAQDFSSYIAPVVDNTAMTEEEMTEIDEAIEIEKQKLPVRDYILTLSPEEFSYFLRANLMPTISGELEIALSEGVSINKNALEDTFYSISEMDFDDLVMCLEDRSMLVENVRQLIRSIAAEDSLW